jgi:hypothetical protein
MFNKQANSPNDIRKTGRLIDSLSGGKITNNNSKQT